MVQPVCCASHQQTELWLQVQYSQRNLPNNSQRKYVQTVHIPKCFAGEYELTPSFPMELKDVQMLSVSPSGTCSFFKISICLTPMAHPTFTDNQLQSTQLSTAQMFCCGFSLVVLHEKPHVRLDSTDAYSVYLKDTTYIKMQTCVKVLHHCWQASVHWWCVEAVKGVAVHWRSGWATESLRRW